MIIQPLQQCLDLTVITQMFCCFSYELGNFLVIVDECNNFAIGLDAIISMETIKLP